MTYKEYEKELLILETLRYEGYEQVDIKYNNAYDSLRKRWEESSTMKIEHETKPQLGTTEN